MRTITVAEIRKQRFCSLSHYFATSDRTALIPTQPPVTIRGLNGRFAAHETHHVIGGCHGRVNHVANLIRVHVRVHHWLTDNTLAGRVLCLWELRRTGRLDFGFLTSVSGKKYPGCLECDSCIEACEPFPFIQTFREELVRCCRS